MGFLPPNQLKELASFATWADKEARSDLSLGYIKGENDYTANFTGALRRIINSNSLTGLTATSFLLPFRKEQIFGADAAIILSHNDESKVAILEAKWPRFKTPGYQWDYAQTASGLSHFSDQLYRQAHQSGTFAIFEMFYCEYPFGGQPPFLDANGSSCVWHEDAVAFLKSRPNPDDIWTQSELQKLLTPSGINISSVMTEFGMCNQGKPIRMIDAQAIGMEFRLPQQVLAINADVERKRQS